MRTCLALTSLLLAAAPTFADITIRVDNATQRYTFHDGEKPVLTYNFGTVPVPDGVKGKYAVARSDYVHPIYGPNGEVLTTDYSKDHPHHRGIYWAWPEVTYKGEKRDLHALQGVFARPVKMRRLQAGQDKGVLEAENVWKWSDAEPIVKEITVISVGRAEGGLRPIDFAFTFEALVPGVTLARRGQKLYGGFNVRASPRAGLKIDKHLAASGTPFREAWAELLGVPPGGKEPIGLFMLQSPSNPEYPGDWVEYANLPWLQPTFPSAGTAFALDPARPLSLRYRVIVRHAAGLAKPPAELFAAYTSMLQDPLAELARYQSGQSRRALTAFEAELRGAPAEDRPAFAQRILNVLGTGETSGAFRRWACQQLVIVGTDASVPVAVGLLTDATAWMQAGDVLLALPGEAGLAALRKALPRLPVARRAALLQVPGVRRDGRAVPLLAAEATSEPESAAAAVTALGRIATPEAAEVLAALVLSDDLRDGLQDARLAAAGRLVEETQTAQARLLYDTVWKDGKARPWQRAGALRGLAVVAPREAVAPITAALVGDDPHLRNGAAAALRLLDAAALAAFRPAYAESSTEVRLALLDAWAAAGLQAAEVEMIAALTDSDPSLQLAGARALKRAGSGAAVGPLLDAALHGKGLGKEAEAALVQLQGDTVAATLREALAHPDDKRVAIAVEALGARGDDGYLDDMLVVVGKGSSAAERAALTVLRNDGGPPQLPPLRKLLMEVEVSRKAGIARAIVAICKRSPDVEKLLASVLGAPPAFDRDSRAALLAALPGIGGEQALAFVTRTQDEAAMRALINWPDEAAVEPLLKILQDSGTPEALRSLTAAGFVQYAKRVLPVTRQATALAQALPHVPEGAARAALEAYVVELTSRNLALNRPVKTSHPHQASQRPELAVDGNGTLGSFWSCAHSPTWLMVDLGEVEQIASVQVINYWDGTRYYQYVAEVSTDGEKWTPVADMSKNTTPATAEGVMHRLQPTGARYVRVTMLKNSANPGMHIVELKVFGPQSP